MKVSVISLGCVKNLVDTERLLFKLKEGGARLTWNHQEADVIVINTCGFIEPAKMESIQTILEFAQDKKVIAVGCLVQRYKEELQREIPEVMAYFGTESWNEVVEFLDLKRTQEDKRLLSTPKSYAYLKIAEGCNRLCSFCAIPSIRGRYKSLPMERIIEEAKELASQDVKELCIVSQDTTYYGRDLYGKGYFIHLLQELEKIEGIEWIRLLYLYPSEVDKDLILYIKDSEKVLPYLDIPLQHVSDKVLRSMRRGYTKRYILELLDYIYKHLPHAVLRTTFIVGYPEETQRDYEELLSFVEQGYFHWEGAFPYYREEGTPAFDLGDPVPEKEKSKRLRELLKAQRRVWNKRRKALIGKEVKVLIDGYDQELGIVPVGRTYMQAPEVDSLTYVEANTELKPRDMVVGRIEKVRGYELLVRVK